METYASFQKTGGTFEPSLRLLAVIGEKAGQLLHGQLSNSLKDLKDGQGNYNLLLSLKGKVVADMFIYRQENDFFILATETFAPKIQEHLQKFAPLSRVTLEDRTPKGTIIHVCSPEESLERANLSPITTELHHVSSTNLEGHSITFFRSDRLGVCGYDVILKPEDKSFFMTHLEGHGFISMDKNLQELIRVEQGVCKVGQDATEDNLPQESRLDGALHFNKGCYLGQEIIARLHFKGHVNKVLKGLKIDSDTVPPIGTEIFRVDKAIGKITSSVFCPRLKAPLVLGYVPYKEQEVGTEFLIGENRQRGVIVELPLK